MNTNDLIYLGKINGFHGLKGFMKIFSETRPRDAIFDYSSWWLLSDGKWSNHEIEASQIISKSLVVKLKNFDDRTSVEPFMDAMIYIEKSLLPKLENSRYYWHDLIGLTVINQQNETFGIVQSLMETGANDVLVVQDKLKNRQMLIPFTLNHAIINVDLENKTILVDWEDDEN